MILIKAETEIFICSLHKLMHFLMK